MRAAISRYGARVLPNTEELVADCKARGEFIQGPRIAEFEATFARRHGLEPPSAIAAAYGRMAFYYILKALDLPPGSEIIFPSLTFWVVPELARVAGLSVVFADVDPATFNMDPASLERLITDKTRAIVPTHLYGLPCDMDRILAIAGRHNLIVLEDCAHSLGARYKGKPVGTFGTGALFSFQTLKPLNCYGGGLALVPDAAVAAKVRAIVDALPWPGEKRVRDRVLALCDEIQRRDLTLTFEAETRLDRLDIELLDKLYAAGFRAMSFGVESLDPATLKKSGRRPIPQAHQREIMAHCRQLGIVTAAFYVLGFLQDDWNSIAPTIDYATDMGSTFAQFETLHVDVPPDMELFGTVKAEADGARRAAQAMQVPVYAGLSREQIERVAATVRDVLKSA